MACVSSRWNLRGNGCGAYLSLIEYVRNYVELTGTLGIGWDELEVMYTFAAWSQRGSGSGVLQVDEI